MGTVQVKQETPKHQTKQKEKLRLTTSKGHIGGDVNFYLSTE